MITRQCFYRAVFVLVGLGLAVAAADKPTVPSAPQTGRPWENSLGMKLVPVPGTRVLFSIWDTRVRDFARFVTASGYDATSNVMSMTVEGGKRVGASWKSPGFDQDENHPVCGVNWYDAQAFSAWLTKTEQTVGHLGPKQSYRLPTDSEWSIAVGLPDEGTGQPEEKSDRIGGVYPWGNQWPPTNGSANYAGEEARAGIWPANWGVLEKYRDDHARTSPVGSYPPNRFGLFDMGGNVWQWCVYGQRPPDQQRLLRGGSFLSHFQNELLSSHRFLASGPDSRGIFLGFRCVLALE